MELSIILLIVLVIVIIFFFILFFVLNANAEPEPLPTPPPPPTPENEEVITVDGIKHTNYIFKNAALRMPEGLYISTLDNFTPNQAASKSEYFYGITTSLQPTFEWTAQNKRIKTSRYSDWVLALDDPPEFTEGYITTMSIRRNDSTDKLQDAINNGSRLIFLYGYSEGYYNIITGLGTTTYKSLADSPFNRAVKPVLKGEINEVYFDTYTISIGPYNHTAVNAVMFSIYLSVSNKYLSIKGYNELGYNSSPVSIWNSVNFRIVNSMGGVLSIQNNSDITTSVLFTSYDSKNTNQEAVIINNVIYFIGSRSYGYCYMVNLAEINTSLETINLIATQILNEEVDQLESGVTISFD